MTGLAKLEQAFSKAKGYIRNWIQAIRKLIVSKNLHFWIGLLMGIFLQPFILTCIQFFTPKWLGKKHVNGTISPIFRCTRSELDGLARELGINQFDLSLDDPLISDYYLIRLRFRNGRTSIDQPLRFSFSTGSSDSKIIDVKRKIYKPQHKSIEMIDSIPKDKLQWDWPESGVKASITWNYPNTREDGVLGFNIYRSSFRDCGYGRVNSTLITSTKYDIIEEARHELYPAYYIVIPVDISSMEEELGEPLTVQNLTPLSSSSFKKKDHTDAESSISDLVNKFRYSVDISFLNGLDAYADLEVYLLCKALPGTELSPAVDLIGSPSIQFTLLSEPQHMICPPILLKTDSLRLALTPKVVNTYVSDSSIYLVWQRPEAKEFAGVRIFRSVERRIGDLNTVGEEVYDGLGMTDNIELDHSLDNKKRFISDPVSERGGTLRYFYPPPESKRSILKRQRPSPPWGLRFSSSLTLTGDYFVDIPPDEQKTFTYTIYAYDYNGGYSYPILVNASLADSVERVNVSKRKD